MSFEVNPQSMRDYAQAVDGLHDAVAKIREYMQGTACDKSGFTGLFVVLQPVVDLVGNLYGETLKFGDERLTALAGGMRSAADHYQRHDDNTATILAQFGMKADELDSGIQA
ncbi:MULTISPECIES: hypothetical protein [Amycolatopsis]|uniref:Excreted virulence factor EspC (Type VII ESX diderm) n=2 Tax=Amycolatopsis TaxID=1813 RepID=A0A2A9F514_9PSEU|nr:MULTISPECIES: hypothetical protein [Amycolatopsis]PFG46477.1 hypothetical protein ATK36_1456 [Amycolatopsis sulphurea]